MNAPPLHPDTRRRLRERLLDLSPRAFELFAGDLLEYIGLQNVAVTQYTGDGGIDAWGELVSASRLVCVPTGVQVKRHRGNVGRPDIDRFVGALLGRFQHGIFITTANYAPKALAKANHPVVLRIDTISGDQVAALMVQHQLGTSAAGPSGIDDQFFQAFEAQAGTNPNIIRETPASYSAAPPPVDDLITLQTLSYAIHVEASTIRRGWIETDKLTPDSTQLVGTRTFYFFRRERIDAIRQQFRRAATPQTGDAWRQQFLDFAHRRTMTRSYKPVLLKALIGVVDRTGAAPMCALAEAFRAFYVDRARRGLPTETGVSALLQPEHAPIEAIERLIIKNPLERFVLQGFLEHDKSAATVRFNPTLWHELRAYELIDIVAAAEEQLRFYYARGE